MTAAAKHRATYQDVVDADPTKVAELVDGELFLSPRPAYGHARASTLLGARLVERFDRRELRGGGGFVFLFEPELHFGADVVVPDIAAWRYENRPESLDVAFTDRAPDWLCETLSPSTARLDRSKKLPLYAARGVAHVWIVDPKARTVEVLSLDGPTYRIEVVAAEDETLAAAPFPDPPIELARLWSW